MDMTQHDVHPGDTYARSEFETWISYRIGVAERQVGYASGAAFAALTGHGSKPDAKRRLAEAEAELASYEAARAAYEAGGQPHHRLIERFTNVAGSIGAAGFFAVEVTPAGPLIPANDEQGLDPVLAYQAANREMRARNATVVDALRRWGWWTPGGEPTAAMREEWALDLEERDRDRVALGEEPMYAKEIAELRGQ
jgi:hypothetical protein